MFCLATMAEATPVPVHLTASVTPSTAHPGEVVTATVHVDIDPGWHARYYDKFAVQIASAPGQRFCFEGESLETRPGDVFWFDNQHLHWIDNDTPYERVTMIVCIRKES